MSLKMEEASAVESLSQFPPFCYFPIFFNIAKTHVCYWTSRTNLRGIATAQLLWHLSNMDAIQESNRYFYEIENFAYGEVNERSFSNPHLWCLYLRPVIGAFVRDSLRLHGFPEFLQGSFLAPLTGFNIYESVLVSCCAKNWLFWETYNCSGCIQHKGTVYQLMWRHMNVMASHITSKICSG